MSGVSIKIVTSVREGKVISGRFNVNSRKRWSFNFQYVERSESARTKTLQKDNTF